MTSKKEVPNYKWDLEQAEGDIVKSARELSSLEKSLKDPYARSGEIYSFALSQIEKAITKKDRLYKEMIKAARACTSDHAHAAYDGERWCPTCGASTSYSRHDKRR
jgi:hypothetical protein